MIEEVIRKLAAEHSDPDEATALAILKFITYLDRDLVYLSGIGESSDGQLGKAINNKVHGIRRNLKQLKDDIGVPD